MAKRFFTRHPKATTRVFTLVAILGLLCLAEWVLRMGGNNPGAINKDTDFIFNAANLHPSADYKVDSFGIMSLSDSFRRQVQRLIAAEEYRPHFWQKNELSALVLAYRRGTSAAAFQRWADSINTAAKNNGDEYLNALSVYTRQPVNEDGFRSIAMENYNGGKKKILLLGDSYTFGLNATPLVESFYDKLLMDGSYVVYNTGIISVDPAQYLAVARKYCEKLRPDYVIINYYWGNDVLHYMRTAKPYQWAMYPFGNGMIDGYPFGEYLTIQQANEIARLSSSIPHQQTSFINRCMAKTVLSTKLWMIINRLKGNKNINEQVDESVLKYMHPMADIPLINRQVIDSIFAVGEGAGAKVFLSILPDFYNENTFNGQFSYDTIFGGIHYLVAPAEQSWYNGHEGHFNNYGMARYSGFLLQQIDSAERMARAVK